MKVVVRVVSRSCLGRDLSRLSHMQDTRHGSMSMVWIRLLFVPSLTITFVGMEPKASRITQSSLFSIVTNRHPYTARVSEKT